MRRLSVAIRNQLFRLVQLLRWYWHHTSVERAQAEIAHADAHKFIYENSGTSTLSFSHTSLLRRYCIEHIPKVGGIFEFGVFRGDSINAFAEQLAANGDHRRIYGFDSFTGFSEEWSGQNETYSKDHFDLRGRKPTVRENVELVEGFIEETLPQFVTQHAIQDVAFIHIDTDTYSPAKVALTTLKPFLRTGSIVLFDEFCGYSNWRSHEFKALNEVLDREQYEFIGFASGGRGANLIKAAIRIL